VCCPQAGTGLCERCDGVIEPICLWNVAGSELIVGLEDPGLGIPLAELVQLGDAGLCSSWLRLSRSEPLKQSCHLLVALLLGLYELSQHGRRVLLPSRQYCAILRCSSPLVLSLFTLHFLPLRL